jgi:hypothetical protein
VVTAQDDLMLIVAENAAFEFAGYGHGSPLARWPASGLWVLGFFVGLDLFLYGGIWISLALSLRTM